jgi:hypothetical protein
VAFRFIFIFEAIAAIRAFILLFLLMRTRKSSLAIVEHVFRIEELLEFFLRVKFLWLFRAAFAYENALHLRGGALLCLANAV